MCQSAKRLFFGLLYFFLCAKAFAAQNLEHHTDITWASPKGFDLKLDIAAPKGSKEARPVLVIFHGGGWLLNDKAIMTDLAHSIAERANIVTVNVDYRLLSAIENTTTINEIIEDAMGAVLWVKSNIHRYGGDPTKVAVTGDSAGGHLAAMATLAGRNLDNDGFSKAPLGFKPTYLPEGMTAAQVAEEDGLKLQAVILSYAGFSMFEVASRGFESEDNPFWEWAGVTARGMFGNEINVDEHPEYYRAASPNHYLVNAKQYRLPPQFVHVGADDPVTTPESATKYVEQLKALGQPVHFKIYQDKGHGFLDSGCNDYNNGCFEELSKPAVTEMVEFLNGVFDL